MVVIVMVVTRKHVLMIQNRKEAKSRVKRQRIVKPTHISRECALHFARTDLEARLSWMAGHYGRAHALGTPARRKRKSAAKAKAKVKVKDEKGVTAATTTAAAAIVDEKTTLRV